jgi:ribulose-phosphate 3-epimerase
MRVIPVINCPDIESVQKRIAVAKTFLHGGDLLHLDVTDGSFATHKTWSDPQKWGSLGSPFALEVHLMVDHPEQYVDNWLAAGARRIIVHVETLTPQSLHEILSTAERYQAQVVLSSKPESVIDELGPYMKHFSAFQVLAVQPGPAGQIFLPFVSEKISFLREEVPDATIEVDGGMNRGL